MTPAAGLRDIRARLTQAAVSRAAEERALTILVDLEEPAREANVLLQVLSILQPARPNTCSPG